MASSRRSRPSNRVSTGLVFTVAAILAGAVRRGDRLAVALSGGVDSVVLLDVLARLARRQRFRLSAIHVNHQISPNAKRWAAFCRKLCRERKVALTTVAVAVPRGNSLEAAARAARYGAFREIAANYIVLAHNQDDQGETLLLQLLRGAGAKGLAAMPLVKEQGGRRKAEGGSKTRPPATGNADPGILRPLLDVPRTEILKYAKARRLQWIEDESNDDTHFARNFLRHEVLPVIERRFPAYRATLARAARNLAAASQILDTVAASDGAAAGVDDGALAVDLLRGLPAARAENLLRHYLSRHGVAMPNAERLGEALRQALTAKSDARVLIELGKSTLRRFDGRLHVVRLSAPPKTNFAKRWRGERNLPLPELDGALTMTKCRGTGISLARLQSRVVSIRVRQGGERLQPECGRPRRSLKNLLQEMHIPPWQRDRMPLLFCDGDLVWAPGIGVACEYQARHGEPAIEPGWAAGVPSGRATRARLPDPAV